MYIAPHVMLGEYSIIKHPLCKNHLEKKIWEILKESSCVHSYNIFFQEILFVTSSAFDQMNTQSVVYKLEVCTYLLIFYFPAL